MKLAMLGILLATLFFGLAGGALGVLTGHPLFTGPPRMAASPVTVQLVPPPSQAIDAPAAR